MKDERDDRYSHSYDIIFRGVEILSGAQREHRYDVLINQIEQMDTHDTEKTKEYLSFYLDSFKYGSYPHGGGGFGLERIVKCILGLSNIREACLFPRDPDRLFP